MVGKDIYTYLGLVTMLVKIPLLLVIRLFMYVCYYQLGGSTRLQQSKWCNASINTSMVFLSVMHNRK